MAQPAPSLPSTPDQPDASDGRVRIVLLLCLYAYFLLSLLAPTLSLGLTPDAALSTTGEGSPLRQACVLLVTATLFVALRPWAEMRRLLAIPLSLAVLLLYCWLSVLWAIEPMIALRRAVSLTLGVWTIFALMRQFRFEEVLTVLRLILGLTLLANYAAVFLDPAFGIHSGTGIDNSALAGNWRGILEQKNIAGAACAFTILLFAFHRGTMPRWLQIGTLAAAAYFLYRTESKTSISLCLVSLATGIVFLRYRLRHKGLVIAALTLLTLAVPVLNHVYNNPLLAQLDDPSAFTGRTRIWSMLIRYIGDHPLLGSGYGSFWNIGSASPVYTYGDSVIAQLPYGHNGFLDTAAQIGLPGLLLTVVVVILLPFRKMLDSPLLRGQKGAVVTSLFLFCFSYNFTETALLYPDAFVWTMLLATIALSRPDLILYRPERFSVQRLMRLSPRP